jgi:hypothetical protein
MKALSLIEFWFPWKAMQSLHQALVGYPSDSRWVGCDRPLPFRFSRHHQLTAQLADHENAEKWL